MDIPVYRGVPIVDRYGDAQMPPIAEWPEAFVINGKYGPSNPGEPLDPGKDTVITGGAVYSRDPAARSVLVSDAVGLYGLRYAVDGEIEQWISGVQFGVKAVIDG